MNAERFLVFFALYLAPCNGQSVASQLRKEKIHNVTYLLDKLLVNYEKSIRPNMGERPTQVHIDIYVRSMGPISELDGSYALDCYFRQRWTDDRLTFSSTDRLTLSLGMSMLDKIWKPDTYIWNGRASYLHKLTTPNRLVRLSGDGSVLYSSRLTIRARCPMLLTKFPFDLQICKLIVGSFGYRSHEVKYVWTKGLQNSVKIAPENQMSQFEVKGVRMFNGTTEKREANAAYSALEVHFLLKRHLGYFLINFYVPCTLVVLMSWVGLWINREATADRITLGVTSVLTMTFLCLDSRSDLPHVEYPTALDMYIFKCYVWLFLCIIEYAVVHSTTKYNTGDPELREIEKQRLREMLEHNDALLRRGSQTGGVIRWGKSSNVFTYKSLCIGSVMSMCTNNLAHYGSAQTTNVRSRPYKRAGSGLHREASFAAKMYRKWSTAGKKTDPEDVERNSISNIDRAARILFPIGFAAVSALYWHTYLNE